MADRYRRIYKKKKPDPLYNTLIYQIWAVIVIVLFLIFARYSDNEYLKIMLDEMREYSTVTIDFEESLRKILKRPGNSGGKPNSVFTVKNKIYNIPENCSNAPIAVSTPLKMPVNGEITSDYGLRTHPVTDKTDFHTGIDIAVPLGTNISSALGGVVVESGEDKIYGKYIVIDHGSGLQTVYCHCSEIFAKENMKVKRGERIAKSGNTGMSTGPHLHFEVKYKGVNYDPKWLV